MATCPHTPTWSPSTSAPRSRRRGPAGPGRTAIRKQPRRRAGDRCASSGSRATRSPTPGTTAGSSRRSTPSPRRTSTCGRSGSASRSAPAMFGENLTTAGLDVNEAVLGEHWRIGTALLSPVRGPHPVQRCSRPGWAAPPRQRRVGQAVHRGGPARALPPGPRGGRAAGRRRDRAWSTAPSTGSRSSMMFRALITEPDLLPRLLDVPGPAARPVYDAGAQAAEQHRARSDPAARIGR